MADQHTKECVSRAGLQCDCFIVEDEEKVCREILAQAYEADGWPATAREIREERGTAFYGSPARPPALSAMREYARRLRASHPVGVTDEMVDRAISAMDVETWRVVACRSYGNAVRDGMRAAITTALASPNTTPTTDLEEHTPYDDKI